MKWLFDTLWQYPEIAIFLTSAIGFWVGQMRLGKFSLGVVTSTLLARVLIGQLDIASAWRSSARLEVFHAVLH